MIGPGILERHVRQFLITDTAYMRVQEGFATAEYKRLVTRAKRAAWLRILINISENPRIVEGGEERELDSDDEGDDGVWSAYEDFVNPLWKLQLAPGKYAVLDMVIDMLPSPPS